MEIDGAWKDMKDIKDFRKIFQQKKCVYPEILVLLASGTIQLIFQGKLLICVNFL